MGSTLSSFLAQNAKKIENKQVIVSNRFVDENGNAIPWEICCITANENARIRRESTKQIPVAGRRNQYTQEFDASLYQAKLAASCTVFPNLNDAELQSSYGVMDAESLITTMLTSGEFEDYSAAVLGLNGFASSAEMVEDAKN